MTDDLDSTNFDQILQIIGPFGKYQILHVFLTGLCAIPVGAFNFANVFFAAVPDYWCVDNRNNTLLTNSTIQNGSYVYNKDETNGKCYVNFVNISVSGVVNITEGISSSDSGYPCSEWEFDQSVYYSTTATEWNLVCSSEWMASLSQTTYMLGFLLGSLCFGALSDRFGRKTSVMLSVSLMIVSGTTAAFMPNFWAFIAVRIVSGMAASGEFAAGFVITMEIIGKKERMRNGIFYQGWFAAGYMLMSLGAYFLRNFRQIALLIGLCPLLVVPCFWFLDESPRWLLSQGKIKSASKVIRRASRLNKATFPEDLILAETKLLNVNKKSEVTTDHTGNILDLFRTPNLRKKTVIICYLWFVCCLVYYGLSFGTRSLLGGPYFNLFLSGLTEFPSFLVAVLVLDRIGRRCPMAFSLLFGGICCLGMALVPKDLGVILTVLSMSGKFFISGGFAIIYVYSAELFPTVVRTVGVGAGSVCAMISGLLAPFVALLGTFWPPLPYIVFGGISLLGGLLTLLLPETLHKCLPETLEDGEILGRVSCSGIFKSSCMDHTNSNLYTGVDTKEDSHNIKPKC